jgi:hypothetical protein
MLHEWGGEKKYTGFWQKPQGKRPLGRPWSRWDNIKIDLDEIKWVGIKRFIWIRIETGSRCLRMRY